MKSLLVLLSFIFVLGAQISYAATCTAISNGNWTDPSTWSCGAEPACGDLVIIPAGLTVIVDDHVNLDETSMPACSSPTHVLVFGTLDFSTGKKIYLACGSSVEIFAGGLMDPGTGGGTSNLLEICQQEEWKAGDGPVPGYELFGTKYPLALELVAFSGYVKNGLMYLSWTVENEKGNDYFTVRYTGNGDTWNKSSIQTIGDHQGRYTYAMELPIMDIIDESIAVELSATDVNGRSEVLDMLTLRRTAQELYVTPNPVGAHVSIKVVGLTHETIEQLKLVGVDGKVHLPELLDINGWEATISVIDLAPGTYFLFTGSSEPLRFVK